jgi:hypothetical protein
MALEAEPPSLPAVQQPRAPCVSTAPTAVAAASRNTDRAGAQTTASTSTAGEAAGTPAGRRVIEAIRQEKLVTVDVPDAMLAGVASLR